MLADLSVHVQTLHRRRGQLSAIAPHGINRIRFQIRPSWTSLRTKNDDERDRAISNMVQRAKDNGLPKKLHPQLDKVIEDYRSVFHVKLPPGPHPNYLL